MESVDIISFSGFVNRIILYGVFTVCSVDLAAAKQIVLISV